VPLGGLSRNGGSRTLPTQEGGEGSSKGGASLSTLLHFYQHPIQAWSWWGKFILGAKMKSDLKQLYEFGWHLKTPKSSQNHHNIKYQKNYGSKNFNWVYPNMNSFIAK